VTGVYVHIPFCHVHCPYCDFNAYAGMDDLAGQYVESLVREIESAANGSRISTIYFGGGTPSRLTTAQLRTVLQALTNSFEVERESEISLEANPEDVDARFAEGLLDIGINRLSVGVQSLSPHVLSKLGRSHDSSQSLAALRAARRAGFESLNADLIFGTPDESLHEWRRGLDGVLAAGVSHVSCYALTVEAGTPLASWVSTGRFKSPDDDDQADKYELASELLEASGFGHYEVSSWSKPGFECRHNLGYWDAGDYAGFGAGAHSHCAGRRSWNLRNPRGYNARSPSVEEGFEELSITQRIEEHAILRMRTRDGLDRHSFHARWGKDPAEFWLKEISDLADEGLVESTADSIRPTSRGYLMNGHIARTFLSMGEPAAAAIS
jgi:putative oxygen-independent coproporphyrinogen III oxidase